MRRTPNFYFPQKYFSIMGEILSGHAENSHDQYVSLQRVSHSSDTHNHSHRRLRLLVIPSDSALQ